MHVKGQRRSPITSENLKVMVSLHMVWVDMLKIVKKI